QTAVAIRLPQPRERALARKERVELGRERGALEPARDRSLRTGRLLVRVQLAEVLAGAPLERRLIGLGTLTGLAHEHDHSLELAAPLVEVALAAQRRDDHRRADRTVRRRSPGHGDRAHR